MTNSTSTMSVGAYSRRLSHIFGLAAIAAILCAIYLFLRSGALESQVMVEEPNRVLNDLVTVHLVVSSEGAGRPLR
jgi:hypothetical protein